MLSPLVLNGEHGFSSQAGNPKDATLAGLKLLDSNSLFMPSVVMQNTELISNYMEITKGLLRDGGTDAAKTMLQTKSSDGFISYQKNMAIAYIQNTYPVPTTQHMDLPGEFILLPASSLTIHPSLPRPNPTSLT